MKATTNEKQLSPILGQIINEAKRIEESTKYSSKGHFEASSSKVNYHYWLGLPSVILSGVAGTTTLANHTTIGGILALVVVVLTAVSTFMNPKEKADSHQKAGNKFESLQSKCRRFWTITCSSESNVDILSRELEILSAEKDALNESSPQIPRAAYKKAQAGIINGEADFQVDAVN